ncbi:MAG: acyl carrier protein [Bacilli bacterium]|nr:acyl carrier protein [Bacilli bacterium]
MSEKEKIELLEEMMDLDPHSLTKDTVLAKLDEWDSITILSFIVLLDEEFNKSVKAPEIRSLVTIADALNMME